MSEVEKALLLMLFLNFFGICAVVYKRAGMVLLSKTYECQPCVFLEREQTDVLKGIAIIGIFISHIATHSSFYLPNAREESYALKFILYFLVSLGDIGVAVFFFFSGYGNYLSLLRGNEKTFYWKWLKKRILNSILTFLLCYLTVYLMHMIFAGEFIPLKTILLNCFTLTMPETTTWYLKIQILFYIITFLTAIVCDKEKWLKVIALASLLYSFIMYFIGMERFWWQTALCYVLGMYVAKKPGRIKEECLKHPRRYVIGLLLMFAFVYLIGNHVLYTNYVVRLVMFIMIVLSIIGITYISYPRSRFLLKIVGGGIGQSSFEIYLIHAGMISVVFAEYGVTIEKIVRFIIYTFLGVIFVKQLKRIFKV